MLFLASVVLTAGVALRIERTGSTDTFNLVWNLFLAWLPLVLRARRVRPRATGCRAGADARLRRPLAALPAERAVHRHRLDLDRRLALRRTSRSGTTSGSTASRPGRGRSSASSRCSSCSASSPARTASCSAGRSPSPRCSSAAIGLYLGRVLRWNSWDIFTRPGALLGDVLAGLADPLAYPRALSMTVLCAVDARRRLRRLLRGAPHAPREARRPLTPYARPGRARSPAYTWRAWKGLSPRKREILRRVVEEHVQTGQPVGSRTLVERAGVALSPSTVRSELAELELIGLLTHPHTSAGRVPTESGYRVYAEELADTIEGRPGPFTVDLSDDAERDRGRAAADDRGALADDPPPRARLRARDGRRRRPTRRGAPAAAACRHRRRDHHHRRRHQARLRDRRPGRHRPRRLGRRVPERDRGRASGSARA